MEAMKTALTLCCIAAIAFHVSSGKSETVRFPSEQTAVVKPVLSSEQLSINLPNCTWIKITEWRTSVKNSRGGPSEEAKKILDDICVKSVKGFSSFIKIHKFNVYFDPKTFHQSLCLIPALTDSEGLEPGNLNDYVFRFKNRKKTYNENGIPDILWGYTDFNTNNIYVRNDIINQDGSINKQTVTVFAHELYHAMSWQFKVNDLYQNNSKTEEKMAQQFTSFLGLGI